MKSFECHLDPTGYLPMVSGSASQQFQHSLVITPAEMTPKESLLMPHRRRSAITEQPVIALEGKTMLHTFDSSR